MSFAMPQFNDIYFAPQQCPPPNRLLFKSAIKKSLHNGGILTSEKNHRLPKKRRYAYK